MSKKTPVKKSKRRLKRSVRRSFATALMITAVAVAAIPVPENYADDINSARERAAARAVDLHKDYVYEPTDSTDNTDLDEDCSVSGMDLGQYYFPDSLNDLKAITDGMNKTGKYTQVFPSLNLVDQGSGQWDLGWQFMYYQQDNPKSGELQGVICKYNSQYRKSAVNLELTPATEYYTVPVERFNAYFDSTDATAHKSAMSGMDADPTEEISYVYSDYTDGTTSDSITAKEFYGKYYKDAYDAKTKEFEDYEKALASWNAQSADERGEKPTQPSDLTVIPTNVLTATQRLTYYCDHDRTLNTNYGTGYSLVSVIDSRLKAEDESGDDSSSGNSEYVYVAKGGTPVGTAINDGNEFLVTQQGVKMCAIGSGAFYGVGNVDVLTIPDQIGYIGDEAFAGSFIKEITIVSVDRLGNRAFKNCTKLSKVEINSGTDVIGAECFENSAVTSITLPYTVATIGYGAFANCRKMTSLDLNGITTKCNVKEAAFYNCTALTDVKMENSAITALGKAAFAVESGSSPISFTLPSDMASSGSYTDYNNKTYKIENSIGDYLFAGRTSLEYVVFPKDYGRTQAQGATLPDNIFHGCVYLDHIEFPIVLKSDPYAGGYVQFDNMADDKEDTVRYLFSDIINPDFYVRGPEYNNAGEDAYPRRSTWNENTQINDFVPYVFKDSAGVDCYEVRMGNYRYQANENHELTSCVLVNKNSAKGDLVIPAKVGNYEIHSIREGCFSDEDLRQSIKTITIQDNSISEVQKSVFKGLPNLTKVTIGNSVSAIGEGAFENCNLLTDVTFNSPSGGHEGFTIGKQAFQTGSDKLTFHGDIVEGYAPFDWAMDPGNVIQSNGNIRVCYKSLTPSYLTVMYNPNTDMVTLLDYPKYSQVSDVLNEAYADEIRLGGYASYEDMRVQNIYYVDYGDKNSFANSARVAFAQAWDTITKMSDDDEAAKAKEELYNSSDYGPWVNPDFCSEWEIWVNGAPGTETPDSSDNDDNSDNDNNDDNSGALNTIADFFFEPIIANAANDPQAYFSRYTFDVVKNAESNDMYRGLTKVEEDLVNATKKIVIPAGVQSIDVYGYFNNLEKDWESLDDIGEFDNGLNVRYYLSNNGWNSDVQRMYTRGGTDEDDGSVIHPGLFSGYFDDDIKESRTRGNDLIETVTMSTVEYLPDYAFDSCERLKSVVIGEACKDIGTAPFRACTVLKDVSNNDWYETVNGIVFSKGTGTDGSTDYTVEECLCARGNLVGAPEVTPTNDSALNDVVSIKPGAFEACDYITLAEFTNALSLTEIPEDCFRNCKNLYRVFLPRTVNVIEAGAFYNSNNLNELTIKGKEVFISARAFKDNEKTKTTVYTYEDSSATRYVETYKDTYNLFHQPLKDEWRVIFLGPDGEQIGEDQYVEDGGYADKPEVDLSTETWTHTGWLGTNNITPDGNKIHADTIFIAQGYYSQGMVNGKWTVDFYDGITGEVFWPTQYVEDGEAADAPTMTPIHDGYEFMQYSADFSKVKSNMTILALYKVVETSNSGGNGTTSASTTTTSSATTTTSGTTTSTSATTTSTSGTTTSTSASTTSTSASTTNTSGSSTSTTSSTGATPRHTVTVVNGYGSGSYAEGETVIIVANEPAAGQKFSQWRTESEGVELVMILASATTFKMPANDVLVVAEFTAGNAAPTTTPLQTPASGTVATKTGTTGNNGNTRVDITKPGISNKNLATANVNGSTDNFIVKISETPEATQAVQNALTNKYGSLDDILYYAMDISLYDSTGTTKITDTTGLSVDITIPIPDALVAYGGNNMMGAVVGNDQLEDMSERFTTIAGVPCISFTATHFSPYTIYVNTQNLSEGLLDVTPKTGDPIHPKWFLSIGLAALSILLFMKKDKKTTVKTA